MKEWPNKENENEYQRKDRDSLSTAALVEPSRNESVGPNWGRRSFGCRGKEAEASWRPGGILKNREVRNCYWELSICWKQSWEWNGWNWGGHWTSETRAALQPCREQSLLWGFRMLDFLTRSSSKKYPQGWLPPTRCRYIPPSTVQLRKSVASYLVQLLYNLLYFFRMHINDRKITSWQSKHMVSAYFPISKLMWLFFWIWWLAFLGLSLIWKIKGFEYMILKI